MVSSDILPERHFPFLPSKVRLFTHVNNVNILLLTFNLVYDRLGIAWATSLLGFIAIALLPIPWVLFKYGAQIRAKSRYESITA